MDGIQIGSHYYALTLNLFLTAFFGLMGSIVYFRYQRRVKREDDAQKKLEDAKEDALSKLVQERHDTLIARFDDTKRTIITKIDAHCEAQEKWQSDSDDRFHNHGHLIKGDVAEDIIIRKR